MPGVRKGLRLGCEGYSKSVVGNPSWQEDGGTVRKGNPLSRQSLAAECHRKGGATSARIRLGM